MKVVYGQPVQPEYILLVTVEVVAKPGGCGRLVVIVGLVPAAMVVVVLPASVMVMV